MFEKYKVRTRKAALRDVPILVKWFSDPEYNDFLSNPKKIMGNNDKMRYFAAAKVEASNAEPSNTILFIMESSGQIGLIMFHSIDWRNRNAYLSVYINDPELKNKVYGMIIMAEAIKLAFNEFNLNKITGHVYEFNQRMAKLLEHFGGRKEGKLKDHIVKDGKFHNVVIYSLFKKDYPALLKKFENY